MRSFDGSMHGPRKVVSGLFALGLFVLAGAARADAVPPPPRVCPPGAIGETNHNGPYCAPTTCATDADCAANRSPFSAPTKRVCREQPLCVRTERIQSRSGWSWGKELDRTTASGVCPGGGGCSPPDGCETAKRCVPEDDMLPPPLPPPPIGAPPAEAPPATTAPAAAPSGCACAAAAGGAAPWMEAGAWALACACAALGLRRRLR